VQQLVILLWSRLASSAGCVVRIVCDLVVGAPARWEAESWSYWCVGGVSWSTKAVDMPSAASFDSFRVTAVSAGRHLCCNLVLLLHSRSVALPRACSRRLAPSKHARASRSERVSGSARYTLLVCLVVELASQLARLLSTGAAGCSVVCM